MNFFNIKLHNTTIKRELIAGISTFISMSYILSMNPKMLSLIGMDYDGVYLATIISMVLTTVFSAFYTKLPVAYAPAVSYNIIFLPMLFSLGGGDWRLMLLATYLSGAMLILSVLSGIYDGARRLVPEFIKYSIIAGIGLAVTIIGFDMLHLVEKVNGTFTVTIWRKEVIYCVIALVLAAIFNKRKKRYALTWAVAVTYLIIIVAQMGISIYHNEFAFRTLFGEIGTAQLHPKSLLKVAYQFPSLSEFCEDKRKLVQLAVFVFSMTLTHFFDACGMGLAMREEICKGDMNFDHNAAKKMIMVNGVGGLISGCAGTLSVTSHGESMVGIDAGARTGLSAIVVSICFAASLGAAPFYKMMSGYIVAPAMIYVGYQFIRKITQVRFQNWQEKVTGAFITLYAGVSFRMGEAVIWGGVLFIVLQLVTGRRKEITKWWPLIVALSIVYAGIRWYSYK